MSANVQSHAGSQTRGSERRKFPRMQAYCSVRYLGEGNNEWGTAELHDYSAIGVRMISDKTLLQSSKVQLELVPESKSRVPGIAAEAIVVRCGLREDHRYEIACKLTRVKRLRDGAGRTV